MFSRIKESEIKHMLFIRSSVNSFRKFRNFFVKKEKGNNITNRNLSKMENLLREMNLYLLDMSNDYSGDIFLTPLRHVKDTLS